MTELLTIEEAAEIQEETMKRNLPIFQAYLRGEDVKHLLPFDEKMSYKFRHLMVEEIE